MPILTPELRLLLAGAVQLVIIYWTYRRLAGGDTDPNLQKSSRTDTGTLSILLSGTMAVGLLVGVTALLVAPEIMAGNLIWPAVLVSQFSIHWLFEKREREGM